MYAIVEIAGQQFKVEEGKKIFVHRLKAENGKSIEFDQVLLIEDKGKVVVGEPVIKDAIVEAKILEHLKGDKVIVFKKKRRKGYRVKNGHRQYFTQIEIVSIKEKSPRKPATKKDEKTEAVKGEEVLATPEPAVKATGSKTRTARAAKVEKKKTNTASSNEPAADKTLTREKTRTKES